MTGLLALMAWAALAAADNRRLTLAELQQAEERWKLALAAAGEGVWDYNFATQLVTLSARSQEILKIQETKAHLDDQVLARVIPPEEILGVRKALNAHLRGKTATYIAEHRVPNGAAGWLWILSRGIVVERMPDGQPLRMVGTITDIDSRKSEEMHILDLAQHDVLTGLPNRLLLADRLAHALRHAEREKDVVAVLFFDLDHFKPVNDQYGHATGDALLRDVAQRVRLRLRNSDTLARIGGDEFVAVLPHCDEASARQVASEIVTALSTPFRCKGKTLHISGSVGYAMYPVHGLDGDALLKAADEAMYRAKHNGRACVAAMAAPPR